jgi:hypothetical protein
VVEPEIDLRTAVPDDLVAIVEPAAAIPQRDRAAAERGAVEAGNYL